ncbi:MAG: tyrosine-type recombinase/integrase [Oscillospiraceae bacterium]|nr:tyrosine-type recombinase/integrase [Oscillospiraceae bacterium]
MARAKKPVYTYIPEKKMYKKKIKDFDGKYITLYEKTPDALTAKIKDAEQQIEAAAYSRENPTWNQYAERYAELNFGSINPRTRSDYMYIIESHITPVLGRMRLQDITQDDCKAVLARLTAKSESVYGKAVWLMKSVLESAADVDIISKNPARKLKRGGVKAEEKDALTSKQQQILIDAVRGTVAEPFVMIGLYAGLRREEILGLKWDCVHLSGKSPYIKVKRALYWERNQPQITDDLKSKAAYRDIPIPPVLVEFLKAEKAGSRSDFVMHNTAGGPKTQTQFKNLWAVVDARSVGVRRYKDKETGKYVETEKKLGDKIPRHHAFITIDFDATPHLLRHTDISHLILSGVSIKKVQYLAGHADPQMTLRIDTNLMENRPADLIGDIKRAYR